MPIHRMTLITASLLAYAAPARITVIDPTGKPIQSATAAAECANGQERSIQTDAAGKRRIAIQQLGFENWTTTLPVDHGKEARLDATLQLARRQESVAVKEPLGKRFRNRLTFCTRR